jgi:hypothetical protein
MRFEPRTSQMHVYSFLNTSIHSASCMRMLHLSVQDTTKHVITNTGSDIFCFNLKTLRKFRMKIEPGPDTWRPMCIYKMKTEVLTCIRLVS